MKEESNYPPFKYTEYGKRYGYWWKKWKNLYKNIHDYNTAIDYAPDGWLRLYKPMSWKIARKWLLKNNPHIKDLK